MTSRSKRRSAQSARPLAIRSVPIVSGCARVGYGRSRFGFPTHDHRRLRLKPIVNRSSWRRALMLERTKNLSMRSRCNWVTD